MRQRIFGTAGVEVPLIGQGSWYLDRTPRPLAVTALRHGIDLGMTHIDTAEMYGDAELVIGEAIQGRRDEVFLVSKVLPSNASAAGTIAACERSLRRLGTDYLNCYLLHWRGSYPLAETFGAFELLQQQGKILSWGVSNFDVDDLEEGWEVAPGKRLVCNQVLYNLSTRAIEYDVLPWCRAHEVAVVAYTPLGHGGFPGANTPGGQTLAQIATAHNSTPRQVALAWVVRESNVFTIPKASTPEHVEENAGAGDIVLSAAEIALLDRVFPLGPKPAALPLL